MTEVTNELMYELLKRMHQEMSNMRLDIGEIKSELGSIRGHIGAINSDVHNIYAVLGRHDLRLDRMERRLELRELAEPDRSTTRTIEHRAA